MISLSAVTVKIPSPGVPLLPISDFNDAEKTESPFKSRLNVSKSAVPVGKTYALTFAISVFSAKSISVTLTENVSPGNPM